MIELLRDFYSFQRFDPAYLQQKVLIYAKSTTEIHPVILLVHPIDLWYISPTK